MNRFLFPLLLMVLGFNTSSSVADPISQTTIAQQPPIKSPKVKGHLMRNHGTPSINNGQTEQSLEKPIQFAKDRPTDRSKKPVMFIKDHNSATKADVGDFGPLPTNSYKQKNHNGSDVAPPNPSDFQTVPVESGSGNRRAK